MNKAQTQLHNNRLYDNEYVAEIGQTGKKLLDGSDVHIAHGAGRYINHAHPDSANCLVVEDDTRRPTCYRYKLRYGPKKGKVLWMLHVLPIKKIKKGEELVRDYGAEYWRDDADAIDSRYFLGARCLPLIIQSVRAELEYKNT